jgi:hypothetical protein
MIWTCRYYERGVEFSFFTEDFHFAIGRHSLKLNPVLPVYTIVRWFNMPGPVTSTTDIIPNTPPPQSPPEDIVDISIQGDPNGTSANTGLQTYGPPSIKDQFRFDIENGRFSNRGRYTPLTTNFETVAKSTYHSRANLGGQVNGLSGHSSAQATLFALGYQDASPDSTHASSNVEARAQETRRINSNLDLLNML